MNTMQVSDIMAKDVTTIREEETLRVAAQRIAQSDVGALPIVDANNNVKGVLTDRDIVVQAVARGRDLDTTTARDLEQPQVLTLAPADSLEHAADVMAEHQVRRLPVVDGGKVVGMVSQADVAKTAHPDKTGRMVSEISKPLDYDDLKHHERAAPQD